MAYDQEPLVQMTLCHKSHNFHQLDTLQIWTLMSNYDRFYGLEVRFPGCRPTVPGSDSRHYQIFWVVVSLENWDFQPWGFHLAEHVTPLYPQKLALKFTNQQQALGIVRLRTKGHGVFFCFIISINIVTCLLRGTLVKAAEMVIVWERLHRHVHCYAVAQWMSCDSGHTDAYSNRRITVCCDGHVTP
jgi:hypothetical protein